MHRYTPRHCVGECDRSSHYAVSSDQQRSQDIGARSQEVVTLVADRKGEVVGFVHMRLDEDPAWGALLDNLHVTSQLKRSGIGRRLLTAAARELTRCRRGPFPPYRMATRIGRQRRFAGKGAGAAG